MWETMEFIWSRLLIFSFWLAIPCVILGFIEMMLLVRKGGTKLKRGFKIYGRSLSTNERNFLESLNKDIETKEKSLLWKYEWGSIRRINNEILVQFRSPKWRTSWPYVGYINLAQPLTEMQYRTVIFPHLVLLPFIISGVGALFVAPLMYLNFRNETRGIDKHLEKLSKNHPEKNQTIS
ncbi:hypothetical protein [Candidatus Leptofilum sp.]|uniref:hypothetical protein n=1 Tax=Candidatus Leptofilum sp. TaxID=3241576 RepID=UPI003B5B6F32